MELNKNKKIINLLAIAPELRSKEQVKQIYLFCKQNSIFMEYSGIEFKRLFYRNLGISFFEKNEDISNLLKNGSNLFYLFSGVIDIKEITKNHIKIKNKLSFLFKKETSKIKSITQGKTINQEIEAYVRKENSIFVASTNLMLIYVNIQNYSYHTIIKEKQMRTRMLDLFINTTDIKLNINNLIPFIQKVALVSYRKGETLAEQGKKLKSMIFVLKGNISVS